MLGEHLVDLYASVDRAVLLKASDADRRRARAFKNDTQFAVCQRRDGVADSRIVSDAAAKSHPANAAPFDLTDEINVGDGAIVLLSVLDAL